MQVHAARALGAGEIVQVAHGEQLQLDAALLTALEQRRAEVLAALAAGGAVYGVNTGLGAQSQHRLGEAELAGHQSNLLLGRAAGGPPWLDRVSARAVLATRLATFLTGDAGVSPQLCQRLVAMLNADVVPAIPRDGVGSAGEILPLAHAFAPLIGVGSVLGQSGAAPAMGALLQAGWVALSLGAKEGIALVEGVPGSTALAILACAETTALTRVAATVSAASIAVIGASRDPYAAELGRGDGELSAVLALVREVAGPEPAPRALQAPVSFRVLGPVLAHLRRSLDQLQSATIRALTGVTDSPAFTEIGFIGTAGFHGIDLAGCSDGLSTALTHAAEMSAAQLHRLLDTAVTGLPSQLCARPGPECGLVPVHKRAVGVVHGMRRLAIPACIGAMETSFGQEDLQSFSWQAAVELRQAVSSWREVLSCQLLAVWRAYQFSDRIPSPPIQALLSAVDAVVPPVAGDRPFGVDIEAIRELLQPREL